MPATSRFDVMSLPGPGPWPAAELLSLGWTRKAIRSALDAGRLVPLTRGVYGRPYDDKHAALVSACTAALLSAPDGAAISHATAARLLGISLPTQMDDLLHITCPGQPGRTHRDVRLHGSSLPRSLTVEHLGLPVTSPARTAIDVARGRTPRQALVVLDSGARRIAGGEASAWLLRDPDRRSALVSSSRALLSDAWESVRGWPGTEVVARWLPYVDPCAESPLESTSRARMLEAGLPPPLLAWPVHGASGRTYFADFAWPGARVIGEADGWTKYGERDQVRRALSSERDRQHDLEAAGWRVVRWDSDDRTWVQRLRVLLLP